MKAQEAVRLAWQHHTIVPAFNIPYLPMAKPVAQAIIDEKITPSYCPSCSLSHLA